MSPYFTHLNSREFSKKSVDEGLSRKVLWRYWRRNNKKRKMTIEEYKQYLIDYFSEFCAHSELELKVKIVTFPNKKQFISVNIHGKENRKIGGGFFVEQSAKEREENEKFFMKQAEELFTKP